jgi:hypothetical protein
MHEFAALNTQQNEINDIQNQVVDIKSLYELRQW